jgi:peptide methionine sulfoxide reductase msrA/msrB
MQWNFKKDINFIFSHSMNTIAVEPLHEEEKRILIDKGTEAPFSGEYYNNTKSWTYYCRQCGSALYYSKDKFDSGCGWPSFDDAIPGAVQRTDDADGMRTEITCANCGWHLWHVFVGERATEKNTRHCVNSLSMKFVADDALRDAKDDGKVYEEAIFWGGCFWCIEAWIQRLQWVLEVHSWYAGGKRTFPTYEHICTGCTWHIEVVRVRFDPAIISYETLLKVFFTLHDPTSIDKQWWDQWEQYRSVVFYHNEDQKQIAEKVIQYLSQQDIYASPIVTEVRPLDRFWIAEWYHQDYYNQHGTKPYCQLVINPKIATLREQRAHLLKS